MSAVEAPELPVNPGITRQPARKRISGRLNEYPRPVWWLAAAVLILWTGRGMVVPFLIIYFSQIVGINASIVGTVIAGTGMVGVVFVLAIAGQIDKFGGRPVLIVTLGMISLATLLSAWAHSITTFLLVSLLLYCASQSYWPAIDTVIASITATDKVVPAMSLVRVGMAVGIGIGGLTGGLLVTGGGMPEYQMLFIVSAALIGIGAVMIWRAVPSVPPTSTSETGEPGKWSDVLADRTFLYALIVLFALVLGFTQLNMSVPAFLRAHAGITEGRIGAMFFMNTIIIVLLQVPIAARVDRGNVGRLLAISSVIWSLAFVIMIATPEFSNAAFLVFLGFTMGELLFMPLTAVVSIRLAPVHLRGRYFSLLSITWGTSWAIATLTAGIALDMSRPILLWPAMAIVMLTGAVAALRLRNNLRLRPPAITEPEQSAA